MNYYVPCTPTGPIGLLAFLTNLEVENQVRKSAGAPVKIPLINSSYGDLCSISALLSCYDVISQYHKTNPIAVRFIGCVPFPTLVLAAAVGKENAYINEHGVIMGDDMSGWTYGSVEDMLITKRWKMKSISRLYALIIQEFPSFTPESVAQFNQLGDHLYGPSIPKLGINIIDKPFLKAPPLVANSATVPSGMEKQKGDVNDD